MANKNVAIVSTLKDPGNSIFSFVEYHKKIGIDHIFLFFDSKEDKTIGMLEKIPDVTIFKTDNELVDKWKNSKIYRNNSHYMAYLQKEVMARQLLNVDVAIQACMDLNIRWLLHIDNDELFFTGNVSLEEHFASLEKQNISSMLYLNHEAVPEHNEIDDYFKEVTLFKRNQLLFDRSQLQRLRSSPKREHFLFYSNGKSAGRVSQTLQQTNVHRFDCHEAYNVTESPCILHYPVCGIVNFEKKYQMLGYFDDKWFGQVEIKKDNPFHLECRNVMNTKNPSLINDFYLSRIRVSPDLIDDLLLNKIYFREYLPQNILGKITNNFQHFKV